MKKNIAALVIVVALLISCGAVSAFATDTTKVDTPTIVDTTNDDTGPDEKFGIDTVDSGDVAPRELSKAIIIVPGILGSELYNSTGGAKLWVAFGNLSQLYLQEDGSKQVSTTFALPGDISKYGAQNTYEALYKELTKAFGSTFKIVFFSYDWRMSNTAAATALQTEAAKYTEVVFVAHSMGGLVVSNYLTLSAANRSRTKALITLGTPFVGSAKCVNAMQTGEIIRHDWFLNNVTLYENTVKEICKNSLAAYQLLPTDRYYSITGESPIKVGNINYNTISPLSNASWGKTSAGKVKTQFATAIAFHNSLFNASGVHVTKWSNIQFYSIAGSGVDTISRVDHNASYVATGTAYSNSGDGTVLVKSAGLGTPTTTYTTPVGANTFEHTNLASNSMVISQVKSLITTATGTAAAKSSMQVENTDALQTTEELALNARSWIIGTDNRRINVYADLDAVLYQNGMVIDESRGELYSPNGIRIGTVWNVGASGRKLYALYNGSYGVIANGDVKIEYMDSGYFDKIVEYTLGDIEFMLTVRDYATQEVECGPMTVDRENTAFSIQPTHIYTEAELFELNQD